MGQRGACARKRPFGVHGHFSPTCCARFSYGSPRGLHLPLGESGNGRERPPLFASRIGNAGQADVHGRAIAWEGRSRPINPLREGPGEDSGRPVRALPSVRSRHVVHDPGMTTGDTCDWGPLVQVDFPRPLGRGAGPKPGRSELRSVRWRSASGSAPGPAPADSLPGGVFRFLVGSFPAGSGSRRP